MSASLREPLALPALLNTWVFRHFHWKPGWVTGWFVRHVIDGRLSYIGLLQVTLLTVMIRIPMSLSSLYSAYLFYKLPVHWTASEMVVNPLKERKKLTLQLEFYNLNLPLNSAWLTKASTKSSMVRKSFWFLLRFRPRLIQIIYSQLMNSNRLLIANLLHIQVIRLRTKRKSTYSKLQIHQRRLIKPSVPRRLRNAKFPTLRQHLI